MAFTPSKSTVKDETLVEFLYADVKSDLECVPGIGPANKKALQKHGVQNTYQLVSKFLALKTEDLGVVEHCNAFFHFLQDCEIKNNRHSITKSIAEKVAISFPKLYAEIYFLEAVPEVPILEDVEMC
tara:strand:+ start:11720 stop:12100 length:381 start_codon:yes stop_codon:yes gene_type:complete